MEPGAHTAIKKDIGNGNAQISPVSIVIKKDMQIQEARNAKEKIKKEIIIITIMITTIIIIIIKKNHITITTRKNHKKNNQLIKM